MRASRPLVSVGIPLYNGETYLAQTLSTVIDQSYEHLEIIVVDNASTDSSLDICHTYAERDDRIRIYRNESNLGAMKNYNLAFERSTGTYFKWVAHDDPLAPTAIERSVAVLEDNRAVVLAYPRTILIDEEDAVIEYHDDRFHLVARQPHIRLRGSLRSSAWCHPVFGLVRREVLARTGLIGNYPSSDKVLLAELAILGHCFEIPEHLAYRRLHPNNSTEANNSDEAMAAWFDPTKRTKVAAPRWRRLVELNRAIRRANLDSFSASLCRLELARFYMNLERMAGVGHDMRQIMRWGRRWANQV